MCSLNSDSLVVVSDLVIRLHVRGPGPIFKVVNLIRNRGMAVVV